MESCRPVHAAVANDRHAPGPVAEVVVEEVHEHLEGITHTRAAAHDRCEQAARPEHARDLGHHHVHVAHEHERKVREHRIHARGRKRQALGPAQDERGRGELPGQEPLAAERELLGRHVQAKRALRCHAAAGQELEQARVAAAKVKDPGPCPAVPQQRHGIGQDVIGRAAVVRAARAKHARRDARMPAVIVAKKRIRRAKARVVAHGPTLSPRELAVDPPVNADAATPRASRSSPRAHRPRRPP